MSVNEIAVFVSSSDAYSDIWPAFFALLKREWPEYRGTIYLNTETLEYAHDGLNIVCTKQGNQHRFGAFFLHGVECVEGERFLLFMIDYFLEGRVDVNALQSIYEIFCNDGADTFTLALQPQGVLIPLESSSRYARLDNRASWRIAFSFQVAFWKKESLRKIVATWEDPWRAEYFGSRRVGLSDMKFYLLTDYADKPIKYDESGVLHGGGKWLDSAIAKIDLEGIPIDISASQRGHYNEQAFSLLNFVLGELRCLPLKALSWLSIIKDNPMAIRLLLDDVMRRVRKLWA